MLFPLAVGLTYSLRAGRDRWRLWAVATLTIFAGIAVSVSRSALIGLFAAFALMALYWPIRRTLAMLGGVLGLATLVFVVNRSLFEAYSSTLGLGWGDASAQYRVTAAHTYCQTSRYLECMDKPVDQVILSSITSIYFDWQTREYLDCSLISCYWEQHWSRVSRLHERAKPEDLELPAASAHLFLGLAASFTAYAVMNAVLDAGGLTANLDNDVVVTWPLFAVAFRISRRTGRKQLNLHIAAARSQSVR